MIEKSKQEMAMERVMIKIKLMSDKEISERIEAARLSEIAILIRSCEESIKLFPE